MKVIARGLYALREIICCALQFLFFRGLYFIEQICVLEGSTLNFVQKVLSFLDKYFNGTNNLCRYEYILYTV